jgi:hypothetical protein
VTQFAAFYLAMIAFTVFYLLRRVPPKAPGEWLAMVGLSVLWPTVMAFALYCMVRERL